MFHRLMVVACVLCGLAACTTNTYKEQQRIAAAGDDPYAADTVTCRKVTPLGSRISHKVCKKNEEWAADSNPVRARAWAEEAIARSTAVRNIKINPNP